MSDTVIQTKGLTKEFVRDEFHVLALKDADLEISRGEFIALAVGEGASPDKGRCVGYKVVNELTPEQLANPDDPYFETDEWGERISKLFLECVTT